MTKEHAAFYLSGLGVSLCVPAMIAAVAMLLPAHIRTQVVCYGVLLAAVLPSCVMCSHFSEIEEDQACKLMSYVVSTFNGALTCLGVALLLNYGPATAEPDFIVLACIDILVAPFCFCLARSKDREQAAAQQQPLLA